MHSNINLHQFKLLSFIIIFTSSFLSCSKDSDLLSEYVINDSTSQGFSLVVDDSYFIAPGGNYDLNVLQNDNFTNQDQVTITNVTNPDNGEVTINDNNTINYNSPDTENEVVDTFQYTTETKNSNGQVSTHTGNVTININDESLKAFPSAFGGGSLSSGGRGGVLIFINTLTPNAPLEGPFTNPQGEIYYTSGIEAAVSYSKAAYIVFNVSGNIDQSCCGDVNSQRNYKTIFGQSAPRGGITIHNGIFNVSNGAHDWIVRFLRVRAKKVSGNPINDDASSSSFKFFNGGYNIILDHCSASWGGDKAFNFYAGSRDTGRQDSFTLMRSIASDSHTSVYVGTQTGTGNQELSDDLSVVYNLIGRGTNRLPSINGDGDAEVINNVIHQWATKPTIASGGINLNHINNYYLKAPGDNFEHILHDYNGVKPEIYSYGNFYSDMLNGTEADDNQVIWGNFESPRGSTIPSDYFTSNKNNGIPIPTPVFSISQMPDIIINDVGANRYLDDDGNVQEYIDSWDAGVIQSVRDNTHLETLNSANWILPNIPSNVRPKSYDTDFDGMSDVWEKRVFGNLDQGYNGDHDGDGYTNIEEYMNQVDF